MAKGQFTASARLGGVFEPESENTKGPLEVLLDRKADFPDGFIALPFTIIATAGGASVTIDVRDWTHVVNSGSATVKDLDGKDPEGAAIPESAIRGLIVATKRENSSPSVIKDPDTADNLAATFLQGEEGLGQWWFLPTSLQHLEVSLGSPGDEITGVAILWALPA